ncbi:MAG: hypothetical protein HKN73_04835, partial [Gemmatimonadetes bacterium]|nr:hypothetical protein [Gemmatimonadota bacterium]
ERLRILRELESDLEELSRRLEADGLDPVEARRRAIEALVPAGTVLRDLAAVHTPLYRRFTSHISDTRLRAIERSALAVTACAVVVAETLVLIRVDLLGQSSPFLWPVLALSGLLVAVVLTTAFQIWIKADPPEPRRPGLTPILLVGAAVLVVGIGGAFVDFIRLAAALETMPDPTGQLQLTTFVSISALLSVSLLVALGAGLSWFLLSQWLSFHAGARAQLLGVPSHHPPRKRSVAP